MRLLLSLILVLISTNLALTEVFQDCYLYGKGPTCPGVSDERLTVYGGHLQDNALCCSPNAAGNAGILRICQDCGGDYPYMLSELFCPAGTCGQTKVFGHYCSGSAKPLSGSYMAVCSNTPTKPCVFGGSSYCNGRGQQGYVTGWTALGQIIDYDSSKGFYPGTLALCCY